MKRGGAIVLCAGLVLGSNFPTHGETVRFLGNYDITQDGKGGLQ